MVFWYDGERRAALVTGYNLVSFVKIGCITSPNVGRCICPGFIKPSDGSEDLFCHVSQLRQVVPKPAKELPFVVYSTGQGLNVPSFRLWLHLIRRAPSKRATVSATR